ncbi:MAG: SWIM zinc finger family protein [Oscillospiraceae bacterium]|nr:SWIM zinc finger family protein [Oscillospiraceae bacterium]
MNWYWYGEGGFSQPSAEKLQQFAAASQKKARDKGLIWEPVVIQGRTIAKSWWGQAWCRNLERYADYSNRLGRGKRYVRTGAVVDLKIQKGSIQALVQGSRKTPYQVEVNISPVPEEKCRSILRRCGRRIENLEQLLTGNFPEELKELFQEEGGLFPRPEEISFTCSCPDWAQLCKHVAAVLYGTGARLDEQPALFFALRSIEMDRFIDVALANRVEAMLANAQKPSSRILSGQDLEALFGVL